MILCWPCVCLEKLFFSLKNPFNIAYLCRLKVYGIERNWIDEYHNHSHQKLHNSSHCQNRNVPVCIFLRKQKLFYVITNWKTYITRKDNDSGWTLVNSPHYIYLAQLQSGKSTLYITTYRPSWLPLTAVASCTIHTCLYYSYRAAYDSYITQIQYYVILLPLTSTAHSYSNYLGILTSEMAASNNFVTQQFNII